MSTAPICHTHRRTTLAEMARITGTRWTIEETFQTAKGEARLDHYEVRQYTGWCRQIVLSMLARAFLTAVEATKGAPDPEQESL